MLLKVNLGRLRPWVPWVKTAAQSACISAAADLTTQWAVSEKKVDPSEGNGSSSSNMGGFDFRRAASYGAFGFFYSGFVSRLFYLKADSVFGVQSTFAVVSKKMAADTLVHAPLLYVPVFYLMTGLCQGHSLLDTLDRLNSQYLDTLKAYCMIWPGAIFVMFWAVPERNRIIFTSCCGFFEKCIYSWLELRSRSPGLAI